jgi:hypothetical protein
MHLYRTALEKSSTEGTHASPLARSTTRTTSHVYSQNENACSLMSRGCARSSTRPPRSILMPPHALKKPTRYFVVGRYAECILIRRRSLQNSWTGSVLFRLLKIQRSRHFCVALPKEASCKTPFLFCKIARVVFCNLICILPVLRGTWPSCREGGGEHWQANVCPVHSYDGQQSVISSLRRDVANHIE